MGAVKSTEAGTAENQMDFLEMGGLKQKLGNREVRIWYKVHDEQVSESIDQSLSLEQRVRQACEMRNHNPHGCKGADEGSENQKIRGIECLDWSECDV